MKEPGWRDAGRRIWNFDVIAGGTFTLHSSLEIAFAGLFCLTSNYIQAPDTNKAFLSPPAGSRDSPNLPVHGLSLTRASTALGGEHELIPQMCKNSARAFQQHQLHYAGPIPIMV